MWLIKAFLEQADNKGMDSLLGERQLKGLKHLTNKQQLFKCRTRAWKWWLVWSSARAWSSEGQTPPLF